MNKLYVVLCLLAIGVRLFAQEHVTIDQCQSWAVAQTSANVQKDLNGQILKENLGNASAHLYPKLSLNGNFTYQSAHNPWEGTEYADVSPFDNNLPYKMQYNIGLDFEQTVFEGGKIFFGRRYEHLKNEAEIYKIDLAMNEIKAQVINLYLSCLILDKQMGIIENVQSTFEDQIKQLKVLLHEGVISANTLSQLELEALKIEQNYEEIKAKKNSVISSLSILTGKNLSDVVFDIPVLPETDVFNGNSQRLEFSIFENQKRQLEYQRKLHFSNSLPSLSFFATGGYGRPTYAYYLNKNQWYYMAGVHLHVPVIEWAKTSGVGKVINIQKEILQSKEQDFRNANQIAIQDKLNEIHRIEQMLVLDEQITAKYKNLTKTSSSQLVNGTITAIDYIRQHNDELQSLMNQELHGIQLLKAKYELLALRGQI